MQIPNITLPPYPTANVIPSRSIAPEKPTFLGNPMIFKVQSVNFQGTSIHKYVHNLFSYTLRGGSNPLQIFPKTLRTPPESQSPRDTARRKPSRVQLQNLGGGLEVLPRASPSDSGIPEHKLLVFSGLGYVPFGVCWRILRNVLKVW